jgi:hypothetical protein
MKTPIYSFFFLAAGLAGPATAQGILYDFDNLPAHSGLPSSYTMGSITASLSATGQGFSIQSANTYYAPVGFAGNCIFPNSVYLSDLQVTFNRKLADFSILYPPQELACDSSATMRVTAYMNGAYVDTNTTVADPPGTWPSATLTITAPTGFNSVVTHYDKPPVTGGDYGLIFMADNMNVTPTPFVPPPGDYDGNGVVEPADYSVWQNGFGAAATPRTGPDGNGNGLVDTADYTVWRDHLGQIAPGAAASTSIPEPATIVLACLILGALSLPRVSSLLTETN